MPEPTCALVDMSTWTRRRHFALYKGTPYPFVGITTELDITDFYHACRKGKRLFFPAFFHLVMKALNSLVNFRYRIRENKVVEYDRIDASFVVFNKEDELFYFAYVDYQDEYESFAAAVDQAKKQP